MNRPGRYRIYNLPDMCRRVVGRPGGRIVGGAHTTAVVGMDIGGNKGNWQLSPKYHVKGVVNIRAQSTKRRMWSVGHQRGLQDIHKN